MWPSFYAFVLGIGYLIGGVLLWQQETRFRQLDNGIPYFGRVFPVFVFLVGALLIFCFPFMLHQEGWPHVRNW